MENKSKRNEPKMTSDGKYQCIKDKQVYDTRDDYDQHCKEEHM